MVEHPTWSRRVVGSNPIWDSDSFRVYVSPIIYIIPCCCYFSVSIIIIVKQNCLGDTPAKFRQNLLSPNTTGILTVASWEKTTLKMLGTHHLGNDTLLFWKMVSCSHFFPERYEQQIDTILTTQHAFQLLSPEKNISIIGNWTSFSQHPSHFANDAPRCYFFPKQHFSSPNM